jgi:hypothetical protein
MGLPLAGTRILNDNASRSRWSAREGDASFLAPYDLDTEDKGRLSGVIFAGERAEERDGV